MLNTIINGQTINITLPIKARTPSQLPPALHTDLMQRQTYRQGNIAAMAQAQQDFQQLLEKGIPRQQPEYQRQLNNILIHLDRINI